MILEQCKGVHCVGLGESFQTHIYLQNFVSIQPRTSPLKFAAKERRCVHDPGHSRHGGAARRRRGTARPGLFRGGSDQHLRRARSRLYRSQILQENMRLKAPVEIYTMHSFAQLCNRNSFCQNFGSVVTMANFSNSVETPARSSRPVLELRGGCFPSCAL